jgi:hypothetical protein
MDIHKEFAERAVAQGVKLDGIAAQISWSGIGIIAERELKVCRQTFMLHLFMCYLRQRSSVLLLLLNWEPFCRIILLDNGGSLSDAFVVLLQVTSRLCC